MAGINIAKLLTANPNPIDWTFTPPDGGHLAASPAVYNGVVIFVSYDDNDGLENGVHAFNNKSDRLIVPINGASLETKE